MDADEKVKKRVHWLNTTGGFNNGLGLEKVMAAAFGLEVTVVMKVLKDVEEKRDTVKDPTAYVTAALRKLGGGQGFVDWSGGGAAPPAPPQQNWAPSFTDPAAEAEDKEVRRKIGWLNKDGGFAGSVNYSKIIEAAKGLEYRKVMQFLKNLEGKAGEVKDPTAWVCNALRKAGGGAGNWGSGGSMPPPSPYASFSDPFYFGLSQQPPAAPAGPPPGPPPVDADEKLRKRVVWLNTQGGFDGALDHDKVASAAWGLEVTSVMKVLKDAEEKKDQLKDALAYVTSALRKMGGGNKGGGVDYGSTDGGSAAPMDVDADQKLRRRIGWLNKEGGFDNAINYMKVAEAAAGVDIQSVMEVLKDLEVNRGKVKDPTAYTTAALRKRGVGGNGGVRRTIMKNKH
mmetsp:Transcript_19928/g.43320  ORF Transcript_19928/g.43320 Transcript_19928/m.43320 type:complete len:397 (+) Transcript_19928:161-1351(+)|eukprot:CAMPEP_0206480516 /NCGR_PEP_ID=MMETSP0324_2-20121206/37406_1 /ASSEMBLY_ACC=CAM_ASM_000836 /TAXON_ID=2866 /ORGANISM="Crypthecodinium cohnii, Strain Seligo" /LENGTH=396 /DNA_ID=CAMNT_0053957449 /DNA_START=161 /DNA_END=1351 /DNA_ORIENTATION=-